MKYPRTICALALAGLITMPVISAQGQTFSVGPMQQRTDGTQPNPSNILRAPTASNNRATAVLLSGGVGDINAFSFGHTSSVLNINQLDTDVFFSVDQFATGIMGSSVANQAARMECEADIYLSDVANFTNIQVADGNRDLRLQELAVDLEGVDGLDTEPVSPTPAMIFFSLAGGTTGASGATIFSNLAVDGFANPATPPVVFATPRDLGLTAADDIDALQMASLAGTQGSSSPIVIFSLAPGSPSLSTPGPVRGPGDIFWVIPNSATPPTPQRLIKASELGLFGSDNVNALAIPFTTVTNPTIPFPPVALP